MHAFSSEFTINFAIRKDFANSIVTISASVMAKNKTVYE